MPRRHALSLALLTALCLQSAAAFAEQTSPLAAPRSQPIPSLDPAIQQSPQFPEEAPRGALLLLEVWQNGKPINKVGTFYEQPNGQVVATEEEWGALGLAPASSSQALRSAEQLGFVGEVDRPAQKISIQRPVKDLPLQQLSGLEEAMAPSPVALGVAAFYDIAASQTQGGPINASLGHQVRAPLGNGVLLHSGQLNWSAEGAEYQRGLTTLRYDDLAREHTWQLGDVVSSQSRWSSPALLGGIKIAKELGLNPRRPTYPIPLLGGIAQSDATATLYLNQVRQASNEVQQGPFQWERAPLLRGANEVALVLRDQFGREVISEQQLYFAPELLAPGLSEWSIEVGKVREGADYSSKVGFSATARKGVSTSVTLDGQVQHASDWTNAGMGITAAAGRVGVISGFYVHTQKPQQSGGSWGASYDYQSPRWSLRVDHLERFSGWEDFSSFGPPAKSESGASVGWYGAGGNVSVVGRYSQQRQFDGQSTAIAQLQAQLSHGPWSWSLGAAKEYSSSGTMAWLSGQYSFGKGSVSSTVQRFQQGSSQLQLDTSLSTGRAPYQHRWGASVRVEEGSSATGRAQWAMRGPLVDTRLEVGANSQGYWTGGLNGGLWISDDGVALFRSSTDSFAVVRTPGLSGIPVKVENQLVGKTNNRGFLVVGNLVPNLPNKIDVEVKDLPVSSQLNANTHYAAPRRGLGADVVFAAEVNTSVAITLHTPEGVIAVGDAVELVVNGEVVEETIAGYDGAVFLTKAQPGAQIRSGGCVGTLPARMAPLGDEMSVIECLPKERP